MYDIMGNIRLCRICQTVYATKRAMKRPSYFHTGGTDMITSHHLHVCCAFLVAPSSRSHVCQQIDAILVMRVVVMMAV
jgi:hypothetical protein